MAIAYTDKELDLFVDRNDHLRTNIPGIFANLEFANANERHCSSEGRVPHEQVLGKDAAWWFGGRDIRRVYGIQGQRRDVLPRRAWGRTLT